ALFGEAMRRSHQLALIGLVVVSAIAITVAIAGSAARRGSNPATVPAPEAENKPMVYLKGGAFLMGTASNADRARHVHEISSRDEKVKVKDPAHEAGDEDERPVHRVTLSPF